MDDVSLYGETYWHRQHQLSEMLYCVKHQVRLVNSGIPIKRTKTGFYPASSEVNMNYDVDTLDDLLPYKDKLLKIGREVEWLIKHGLEIDWNANGHDKYWRLLRDRGLASFRGRCDYLELESAFNDYWGNDFLSVLFSLTDDSNFNGWSHQVEGHKMQSYKPLYHIILMNFLTGSISNFINSSPADTPYGKPPLPCENLICSHYHKVLQ